MSRWKPSAHPLRAHLHEPQTLGERAADKLAAVMGSWSFVIGQNIVVLLWIVFNLVAIFGLRWDPAPFILLNLLFSWQASNIGPILQMTSNRQAQKDRLRDDTEAEEVKALWSLNQRQLEILESVHDIQTTLVDHIKKTT